MAKLPDKNKERPTAPSSPFRGPDSRIRLPGRSQNEKTRILRDAWRHRIFGRGCASRRFFGYGRKISRLNKPIFNHPVNYPF